MTIRLQKFIMDIQQGFLEAILNNQKWLPKPLVLPFLLVGQRFGIITYTNWKKEKKSLFLHKLKIKLLESEDELTFFWQSKLQLILTLSFMCFFMIGIFKYRCAFKLVLLLCIYVYIYYIYILYIYIYVLYVIYKLYIYIYIVCICMCI